VAGTWIDHAFPHSTDIENGWIYTYTSTPHHMPSRHGQGQIYLYLIPIHTSTALHFDNLLLKF